MSNSLRRRLARGVLVCAALLAADPAFAQFSQQGPKLVGSGAVGAAPFQGSSVAVSADGNTAIVGGLYDGDNNGGVGAAWVWTRSGAVWTQQGPKLVGTGAGGISHQGRSVALSGDGNTALVGGDSDNRGVGAAWIWTRSGGVWTQQGPKLVALDAVGFADQGTSVALSADGNTALIGGYFDDDTKGAAWVWTRSGGVWTQQGPKLVGSGAEFPYGYYAYQGTSVALSGDGNTALVGGDGDNGSVGAAWVWTRSGGVWTQQGPKLVGAGAVGLSHQGWSVSLAADGNTALVGGWRDTPQLPSYDGIGAAWVWTRSGGVWTQQGPKLVGAGAIGFANQGWSVGLSGDGNTALVGGYGDNNSTGATWVWRRSGGVWTQGPKLTGSDAIGAADQGVSVALSANGTTALVGGDRDNFFGAAWVFVAPAPPTIGPLPRVFTRINTPTPVSITVGSSGAGGPAGLTLNATSSNQTLVLNANLTFSGSGASRTLAITPALNQKGATTITVSASDSTGTASTSFELRVGTLQPVDFDGDGKSDVAVFRPSNGTWYIRNSATGLNEGLVWGGAGDVPVAGDYDGDGLSDMAVFRSSNGTWYVRYSSTGGLVASIWGGVGDVPVAGDYDGDGRTDIAVFRSSSGVWYIRNSLTGLDQGLLWGVDGDVPVPGDYDADGKADMAVFRPSNGTWYIRPSSTGLLVASVWGGVGDIAVSGDYDGDGRTDIGVFQSSTGVWYIRNSSTGLDEGLLWGGSGDVPVPGDYDGDGKTDMAVFRPSNGTWYLRSSINGGLTIMLWGGAGDVPVLRRQ